MGAVRLFLALVVAADHWRVSVLTPDRQFTDWIELRFNSGYAVMFFYVISGFLITYTLEQNYSAACAGPAAFYRNRFIRIFALYWPVALFSLLVLRVDLPPAAADRLTSLVLLGADWRLQFAAYPGEHWEALLPTVHQAWTLGAELTFYLFAPLLMRSVRAAAVVLVASLALRAALLSWFGNTATPTTWVYFFFPSTVCFFMLGHLACRLRMSPWWPKRSTWLIFAGSIAAMFFLPGATFDAGRFWWSVALFAVAVPGLFAATKNSRLLNYIGALSYPLYLTHNITIGYLLPVFFGAKIDPLMSVTAGLAVILVGAALAHVVEIAAARLMRAALAVKLRHMENLFAVVALGVLALIAYAASWNVRRRAAMTPAERERDEEEDRREANIW